MRKITLLFQVMFLFTFGISFGQWTENFENGIPSNWEKFTLLNGAPGTLPEWVNSTGTTCQGTTGAYVSNALIGAGNTSQAWLVTPQVAIPANADLSFYGLQTYPSQNGSIYQLWVSTTSQTDVATFTLIKSWTENEMNPGNQIACFKQKVDLAAYANQNVYLAFVKKDTQYANAIQGDRFTLDDISIIARCLPATSSSAVATGATTANITITGTATGTWEINLIPGSTNAPNTGAVTHTGTSNVIAIADLQPSTPYTYYIRQNCDINQSTWIGPYNFTTFQQAAPLPFSDNFESATVGWSMSTGTQLNKWFVGDAVNNGGENSLYISNNNGDTNDYTITQSSIVHAYRDIVIPAGTVNVGISFDWKALGETNDYFYVWAVPATFNPVAGNGITTAADRIRIADKFYNSANFQPYAYMLNASQFAGQTMRLIFEWRNNATIGGTPPAAIDNITVNAVDCQVPANILYSDITTDSATVNWQEAGSASSWEILIQPWGTPFPAATTSGVTTTQPTYNAGNLNSTSAYDVYVRSVCSATNKSFWVKAATRLVTACGTIIPPFTETFNSTSPSKSCWTVIDANGDNLTWNLNTTYLPYEGDQLASLPKYWNSTSNDDWLISPGIQLNGNQRLKFRYRVVSTSFPTQLEVKLSTTGNTIADFTNVIMPQQAINNNVYEQKVIYLDSYTGIAHIALHVPNVTNNSWTLWIDEFIVEDIPACATPTGLAVSDSSNTTATLSWTTGYQETQWEVKVQTANTGVPTTDGTLVSSPTYNAENLNPATLYEYYVRAYCSSTNKSEWVGPFVFNTTVCPVEDRCDYKFTITATSGNGTFSKLNVYQNGILVGTVNASSGLSNTGTVAMCPGIPFTLNWDYNNWSTYTQEVVVLDSYDEVVYNYVKDVTPVILPITVPVYSGTATCTPVACPKPQNVNSTVNTSTSITVDWTEAGSASSWEVFAVPTGEPGPTEMSVGEVVTEHPYTLSDLTPGKRYSFYIRSVCSDTSKSSWTLEAAFYTQITNDNCDTAYVLPVSATGYCDTPYHATLLGATASPQANVCGIAAYANDDVWFEFTATSASHILYINNREGSSTNTLNLSKVLYSGDCDNLQQVTCILGYNVQYNTTYFITGNGANNNDVLLSNLTVGTTYKLRIFSNYATANDTRFDICIATPATPIAIDQTTYTEEQLISDILVNENCAQVSNLNYSTGTNYGAPHNGIGYFDANGSDFPFQNGIILSTGKAQTAVGPKTIIQSSSYQQNVSPYSILWLGDQDLYDYVSASGAVPGLVNFYNATSIEFDFTAYGTEMSFDFLFASEDYGLFQCNYGDAFAFFLTDEQGTTVNLATLPDTTLPVSVSTTRDSKMNYSVNGSNCEAGNPEFFDKLYDGYKGVSRYAASDNFMGHTVPLQVKSPVVPGATYHIKMVIAETNDGNYDSAIFLDGNSFDVGRINFGDDLLVSTNNAVCFGTQKVLDSKLSDTYFNFVWRKDDVVIDGATGATYTVTEPGNYKVTATVITTGCTTSDEIVVEFNENIATTVNSPEDLTLCSPSTEASFHLDLNTTVILENVANAADYAVSYFETQVLAETGNAEDAISDTSVYTAVNDHIVYVRIENTITGCFTTDSFRTVVVPNDIAVIEFSYATDICSIATQNPAPIKATDFAEGGTYSTTDTNITVDAVTGVIDLTATLPGSYTITYTLANSDCTTGGVYEADVTINATVQPTITFSYADACVLSTNALPVLSTEFVAGGTYSSITLAVDALTGEIDLSTATVGSHDITYAVVADAANCTGADSYTATITVIEPAQPAISFSYAEVCVLSANALPVLPTEFVTGGTYSSTTLPVDALTGEIDLSTATEGNHDITYTVVADVANCTDADSYTATITVTEAAQPAITFSYDDVCVLSANALPVLPTEFVTGGTYSSTTLTVNAQTGEIDLSTATEGSYDIVYSVTQDETTCTAADSYTATIVITAGFEPTIAFTYPQTCISGDNPEPELSAGFVTGGVYSSPTLTLDAQTGEIDLSTATTGTHDVIYEVAAEPSTCRNAGSYTATIVITEGLIPVTSFSYEEAYCMGAGIIEPELTAGFAVGGTFSADNQGLDLNAADGSVNVSNSQQGTYVITYTYQSQQECEQDGSSTFTITLQDGLETTIEDSCIGNALWLDAVPVNNSYDATLASYTWKDGQGVTVGNDSAMLNVTEYYNANPNATLPIVFTVTVTSGECSVSKEFEVFNILCEVQRGISPNNDGRNDNLDLSGMNVNKITIFNRYGHKVYEQSNYTNQWFGQSDDNNDLPTGTYFYILELKNSESKTGWIYINRQQ
ncbi:choice-of-anchor J domain-containing protein [Flavobacterium sp. NRK1]|uniref:choice-of-anchor J domain-containing protein n=1 Tax=Flavobacterium sp. NRK1 TaxID=2954929 RepID=UPI002092AAB2|nr:choice-of-anchor J domain-containing protein [Flavobacterium sp. NRK1]MCO6148911.1 choice-of-anchor J domain-containing protein [Flavobacterium sp. NRK1]